MLRNYELVIITKTSVSNSLSDKATADYEKYLKDNTKILKEEDLGKRILAYPIKKQTEADYKIYYLSADSEVIREISSKLSLDETVLRYLFIKIDDRKAETPKKKE